MDERALRLVAITDDLRDGADGLRARAERAVNGGATMIQLRLKDADARTLVEVAKALVRALPRVPVIVNDRLDVALVAGAAGVHVGPDDLPAAAVRRLVPEGFVVGASVGSDAEIVLARGADYVGIGPLYETASKPDAGRAIGPVAFASRAGDPRRGGRVSDVVVSARGAKRWASGHPWIFRSDVIGEPRVAAGAVKVRQRTGPPLGVALWSPKSEIALRRLDPNASATIDAKWWRERLTRAITRRSGIGAHANAYRFVYGEADGCPSLVVDRYDKWLVIQLLSAGIEHFRHEIVQALAELTSPAGILARNDATVREREGLARETVVLAGDVPKEIEVQEHGVRYLAAPWEGQKTGAFLDQRENRVLVGQIARGRALDCFAYHGSFALHLAQRAEQVTALDSSAAAFACAPRSARSRATRRSCSIPPRSPSRARRCRARRAATRRSTSARCGSSRREGCCSPRAAASISRSPRSSRCSRRPRRTAGAASRCGSCAVSPWTIRRS